MNCMLSSNHPMRRGFQGIALLLFLLICTPVANAQDTQSKAPTLVELQAYVGSYEGRDFSIEGSVLTYFRQGMPNAIELTRIGEDHFDIVIPPGAQIQAPAGHQIPTFKFERSENGVVTTLVILNPDGSEIARHEKQTQTEE